MAIHTENALRGPSIAQIFNLPLAIPTSEACSAEGLVPSKDGQVLDLVPTGAAAVGAVVANEGAIAEEEEVRIGVEEGAAGVATEAVQMPPISGCGIVSFKSLLKAW